MSQSNKMIIDDGFNARFVEDCVFAGILEIPTIKRPEKIIVPKELIPFSCRKYTNNYKEALVFYENDLQFREVITSVDEHLEEMAKFEAVVSPDCSLYYDMPLVLQMTNTYLNRQIGYYLQSKGLYVIPNIRWGDERTYRRILPHEVPFAFLGVEKHSIVSIGSYGCSKTKEEKYHLKEGLRSMLCELEPEVVLVYGAMQETLFGDFLRDAQFVHYPDWTSLRHGRK